MVGFGDHLSSVPIGTLLAPADLARDFLGDHGVKEVGKPSWVE